MTTEHAFFITCQKDVLLAIAHVPERPAVKGVLIVVGGPQYRVGSHRQFLLLARALAANGVAVLRFDYRGMGDSLGAARHFETINEDIGRAVDSFFTQVPSLEEVVIWGLCDGASAAIFYAPTDARVTGMVLLNPWVRGEATMAKTYLTRYYHKKILSLGTWRQLFRGRLPLAPAIKSMLTQFSLAWRSNSATTASATLASRMAASFELFSGHTLIILSGNDLTAHEFNLVASSPPWKGLLNSKKVARRELARANHTFSTRQWRDQVAAWTAEWLKSW